MDLVIRPRQDSDLSALAELLSRQQAATAYPLAWPSSRSLEEFLKRPTEIRAWIAELDGAPVGHVSVTSADDDTIGKAWAAAHNVELSEIRCVAVFFSDITKAGQGIGSRLLATATEFAMADGYPALDVVAAHETPVNLYLRRGWQLIDTVQAPWDPEQDIPIHLMILPRAQ
ncbi:MAG TPA: GNAT family N-acetyltransferase [Flexivirga sp.]|uniref:GNAT family N-acetyltransferase n=1 Tax=Flexivirga sp. TaxID=1962927 RepID=UPI002BD155D2|nr:GNAT family N-acetyltransferase [Flexivirga sp.]HWC21058.1 GNAT family N-acetyltransferase [Flexivirga sp.]